MDPWADEETVAEEHRRITAASALLSIVVVVVLVPAEVIASGVWAVLRYRPGASPGYVGDGFETGQFTRLMVHAFFVLVALDVLVIGLAVAGLIGSRRKRDAGATGAFGSCRR